MIKRHKAKYKYVIFTALAGTDAADDPEFAASRAQRQVGDGTGGSFTGNQMRFAVSRALSLSI